MLLELAAAVFEPGGRFVSIDPTTTDGQHPVARFLAARDRGRNVRTPEALAHLVSEVMTQVVLTVRTDLLRVPYSHAIVSAAP